MKRTWVLEHCASRHGIVVKGVIPGADTLVRGTGTESERSRSVWGAQAVVSRFATSGMPTACAAWQGQNVESSATSHSWIRAPAIRIPGTMRIAPGLCRNRGARTLWA